MYPAGLEIKDTTESNFSASYLDLLLSIGGGGVGGGRLRTSLYDKAIFLLLQSMAFYLTVYTVSQDLPLFSQFIQ